MTTSTITFNNTIVENTMKDSKQSYGKLRTISEAKNCKNQELLVTIIGWSVLTFGAVLVTTTWLTFLMFTLSQ
jgi:hypothetical protein